MTKQQRGIVFLGCVYAFPAGQVVLVRTADQCAAGFEAHGCIEIACVVEDKGALFCPDSVHLRPFGNGLPVVTILGNQQTQVARAIMSGIETHPVIHGHIGLVVMDPGAPHDKTGCMDQPGGRPSTVITKRGNKNMLRLKLERMRARVTKIEEQRVLEHKEPGLSDIPADGKFTCMFPCVPVL